jgi:undecaprenyl-diphosphatase
MQLVSFLGNGILIPALVVSLAALALFLLKKPKLAVVLITATLLGEIIKDLLKEIIKRPRPDQFGCSIFTQPTGSAFPSGHTVFYTVFFGYITYICWRYYRGELAGRITGIFALIMVLLVGFSRVYLGAHWVTDVLAGYLLGGTILFIAIKVSEKWQK